PSGLITTVAGGVGDGGRATNAGLWAPRDAVWDAAGNFYIADTANQRIRRVDTRGVITTVAGNGQQGFSGDGGAATNASLNSPSGVAVDGAGNLFLADVGNNRIRKVGTNGMMTTVAGNGRSGYSGDRSAATSATLNGPCAVAVDGSGNLLIADQRNYRIRRVAPDGIIVTVAGNGRLGISGDGGPATNASLASPNSVAVDSSGNLFIADLGNNRIRQVGTNGIITTVAGGGASDPGDGGLATNANLMTVSGVAVDRTGDLFIAQASFPGRIRKVDPNGIITTVAGGGSIYPGDGGLATRARLNPTSVAVDSSGNLLLVEQQNNTVREVSTNGILSTVAGRPPNNPGDGVAAVDASLKQPTGLTLDAVGNLFIADSQDNRIRKVGTNGIATTVAGNGQMFYHGDGGAATNASLWRPSGVALNTAGTLFIADSMNQRIRSVSKTGIITTVAGNGTAAYSGDGGLATKASLALFTSGVVLDGFGNLLIADTQNSRVRQVDTHGVISTVAGNGVPGYSGDGGPATAAGLKYPSGIAVDAAGNLLIADTQNNRVRQVDTRGIITTVAGNGVPGYSGDGRAATNANLAGPMWVATDHAGNLFIADAANNRVREVRTNGRISTVAGGGAVYPGDGGPATAASLANPSGLALDAAGNLFISDTGHARVRKVVFSDGPTLTLPDFSAALAGNYQVTITNPYGSVTSVVAVVSLGLGPMTVSLEPGPAVRLQLTGQPSASYVLETAASLAPPVQWLPLFTNAADSAGNWSYLDTNAATAPSRFYRAESASR
ncbi:MAG: hypothetical protein KGS61_19545, partial [Verrucomicrobia bacterium]|nr:hypothetical protein [Verrucomicrobiota bacterium]